MYENRNLEFKQEMTNSFLKTVSAFSNFGGGTILFGVSDDGQAVGLEQPEKFRLDLENRINDSISPKPDYTIRINSKKKILRLDVSEGKYKPYLYKGKAYRRSDTASIEVDQVELKRLTLEGANLYYEELPCGKDDLTFSYLESKLISILGIKAINDDILRTFGLMDENRQYNIAAAIFADTNSYGGIDMARFGDSVSEILDRETVAGVSILKQYDKVITFFKRYYQYERIEGFERKTVEQIPEAAFREAIANAVVHRLWDVPVHVRVAMFSDKIEITSPGGLPRGISEEEYLHGYISNLRNPIIGNIFFRLHYIEMFGTGIRRILEAYANASVKPTFEVTENTVRIVLPCTNQNYMVTTDGQAVLSVLLEGRILSNMEIAGELGWSKDKTLRVLNSLISEGYVVKQGERRSTRYRKA